MFVNSPLLLRRPSYSEEHVALNRRLKELQRRHAEFRRLLLGNQMTSTPGPTLLTSAHGPVLIPGSEETFLSLQVGRTSNFLYLRLFRHKSLKYTDRKSVV